MIISSNGQLEFPNDNLCHIILYFIQLYHTKKIRVK